MTVATRSDGTTLVVGGMEPLTAAIDASEITTPLPKDNYDDVSGLSG